jgi:hypothetical protein
MYEPNETTLFDLTSLLIDTTLSALRQRQIKIKKRIKAVSNMSLSSNLL